MPKVILTAKVEDAAKWEAGFKTHGDVMRTYDLAGPVDYAISGNEVVICMEPKDLDVFKKAMESKATADAMATDGVKRDTVKTFVLDKNAKP
jgi:hypothetical protein